MERCLLGPVPLATVFCRAMLEERSAESEALVARLAARRRMFCGLARASHGPAMAAACAPVAVALAPLCWRRRVAPLMTTGCRSEVLAQ